MDICSYCQREYGSKSYKGRIITKTIDHIIPTGKGRGHAGYSKSIKLTHLPNLLMCCNECNVLKGKRDISQFEYFLLNLDLNSKGNSHNYLTEDLVRTILKSINVLKRNEIEPIELDYLTY